MRTTGVGAGGARVWISAAVVIPLAIVIFGFAGTGCRKKPARQGEGVVAYRVPYPPPTARTQVQRMAGDWLLESDVIRVAVSVDGLAAPRGSIVDLSLPGAEEDDLLELAPAIVSPAGDVPIAVRGIVNDVHEGRPIVRVERRSEDGRVALFTEIRLRAGERGVQIHHRIYNRTDATITGLQVADRTRWALGGSFIPAHGYVTQPARADASFVAWVGASLSYALVFLDHRASIEARYEAHGSLDQVSLGPRFDLAPGGFRDERRLLLAVPGPLPAASDAAYAALQQPLGHVRGRLDREALPATIEASPPNLGATLIASVGSDGAFEMSLPPATYRMVAKSPGGEDVHVVDVHADTDTFINDFVLPRPGYLRFRIEDESGEAIPGRMIIRGVPPTRDPNFGPVHRADGAGNVVYSRDGEGEVPLPAGTFSITATHGPEFGIAQQRLKIGKGKGTAARFRLERQIDSRGWMSADLHLHTENSTDSQVTTTDRVTSLLVEDVEIAVGSDHNRVTDLAGLITAGGAADRTLGVAGVEVTTWDPNWGHFNVFPYPRDLPPPGSTKVAPGTLFAAIRKSVPDAVIQINHPRMKDIGYWGLTDLDATAPDAMEGDAMNFDAIEVANGLELGQPAALARNLRDWYALLNLGVRATATGGSDSHQLIYQWAGYPRTYIQLADDRAATVTPEDVARAVKGGRAFVTSGPFVRVTVNDGGPGDTVTAPSGTVDVNVVVQAARWVDVRHIDVVVNGRVVLRHEVTDHTDRVERARLNRRATLTADSWIVVVVSGERPLEVVLPYSKARPVAFSNPVFVDVDGDGKFRAPRRLNEAVDAAPGATVEISPRAAPGATGGDPRGVGRAPRDAQAR